MELKKRIYFVGLIFSLCFVAIVFKAFRVQVVDKEHLISKSKRQFFRERKVYPRRGRIFDREGEPLAINVRTYSIFAIPNQVKDFSKLKEITKFLPETSYYKLKKKLKTRNRFTWVARKIELSQEQLDLVKSIKGVYFEEIPKRLYPNHELASQVLGFVGVDNNGLAGIEHQFDKKLKGEPMLMKYIIDNKGRPVRFVSEEVQGNASDIYLSIDKDIQAISEKTLKEAVEEYDAFRGGIGVMDAETGEVLAIANYPTFDPNDISDSENIHRKLSFISDPFEPGSTFKSFTIASAIENNIVRPDTNYYLDHGRLLVEGHMISEAESDKKFEWLSVEEILKYSSNVGTTKIAFDLTFPKLKLTLDKFKIGMKTGIELPAESRGIFTKDKNVSPLSLSNISFGQGVATTGIQMLAAYVPFANGGHYIKPTILKVEPGAEVEKVRVLQPRLAQEMTNIMIKTVEDGTGTNARISYFKIAGKTSTAQRSNGKGGYHGYIPGFIGYPVGVKKKFVVFAYIDKPAKGKSYYGNTVAAPIVKKVTEYILYKNKEFNKLAKDEEFKNDDAFKELKIRRSRRSVAHVKGQVPNFVGLDKKSANKLAKKIGLELIHSGIGVVVSQTPESGVEKKNNIVVKLNYAPPSYEY